MKCTSSYQLEREPNSSEISTVKCDEASQILEDTTQKLERTQSFLTHPFHTHHFSDSFPESVLRFFEGIPLGNLTNGRVSIYCLSLKG